MDKKMIKIIPTHDLVKELERNIVFQTSNYTLEREEEIKLMKKEIIERVENK
jgi:hypothetical protein